MRFIGEYRFLSNFYAVEIKYEGITYPTVEHAYQAAKSISELYRLEISKCRTPVDAKRLGKTAELRENWEVMKASVMYKLLKLKFSKSRLNDLLLSTWDVELVESNWWGDVFWGTCKGKGANNLGKLLMKIRDNKLKSLMGGVCRVSVQRWGGVCPESKSPATN